MLWGFLGESLDLKKKCLLSIQSTKANPERMKTFAFQLPEICALIATPFSPLVGGLAYLLLNEQSSFWCLGKPDGNKTGTRRLKCQLQRSWTSCWNYSSQVTTTLYGVLKSTIGRCGVLRMVVQSGIFKVIMSFLKKKKMFKKRVPGGSLHPA